MNISDNIRRFRELGGLNPAQLAKRIGVSREMVYAWESGKYKPSEENLGKLAEFFSVSSGELLGLVEVNVTKTVQGNGRHPIPFYDTIAVGGTSILADQEAVREPLEMIYPGTFLNTATGSIRIYGHSMFPKYPAGCIVAYKDADKDVIIWGEDYVIELQDRRVIKRLEKSQERDCVAAVSYNKSEEYVYSPIDIPLHKIKRLYMVVGKVELEASI